MPVAGAQSSLVRRDVAAPVTMVILFFSLPSACTASATEEFRFSTVMSTPSRSNHCWVTFLAMSGLFWWSALTTSMFLPKILPPKSCTARRAAAKAPGPP